MWRPDVLQVLPEERAAGARQFVASAEFACVATFRDSCRLASRERTKGAIDRNATDVDTLDQP